MITVSLGLEPDEGVDVQAGMLHWRRDSLFVVKTEATYIPDILGFKLVSSLINVKWETSLKNCPMLSA